MLIIVVVSQPIFFFFFFCFYSCAPTVYTQHSSQSNPVKLQVRSWYFFALNPPMISHLRVKSLKLSKGLDMFRPSMISWLCPLLIHLIVHTTLTTDFLMFLTYAPGLGLFNILMLFSLMSRCLTPFSPFIFWERPSLAMLSNTAITEFQLPRYFLLLIPFIISSTYHYLFCLFTLAIVSPSPGSMRENMFICFLHCHIHKITSLAKSRH